MKKYGFLLLLGAIGVAAWAAKKKPVAAARKPFAPSTTPVVPGTTPTPAPMPAEGRD